MSRLCIAALAGCLAACGDHTSAGPTDAAPADAPGPPPLLAGVERELRVEGVTSPPLGIAGGGATLMLLLQDELVAIDAETEAQTRRAVGDGRWLDDAHGLDGGIATIMDTAGASIVSRYDEALAFVDAFESPNGYVSREAWAVSATSTWLLAARGPDSHPSLAEVPHGEAPRVWDLTEWSGVIYPWTGVVTAAGIPLFFGECWEGTDGGPCAVRVEPTSGALTVMPVDAQKTVRAAWLHEGPEGVVVVLYRWIDGQTPPASSYAAAVIDADTATLVRGPVVIGDAADEVLTGLAVLGGRAYTNTDTFLVSFETQTLSSVVRLAVQGSSSGGTEGDGLAVIDGELYRYDGFDTSVVIKQLSVPTGVAP